MNNWQRVNLTFKKSLTLISQCDKHPTLLSRDSLMVLRPLDWSPSQPFCFSDIPPFPSSRKNQLQVRLLDWVIESNTKTLTFAAHCGSVWESPNYNVARKWKLGYNLDFLCMKAIMSCIHSSESQHSSSKAHSFLLAPCDKLWNESRINCLENNKDC